MDAVNVEKPGKSDQQYDFGCIYTHAVRIMVCLTLSKFLYNMNTKLPSLFSLGLNRNKFHYCHIKKLLFYWNTLEMVRS